MTKILMTASAAFLALAGLGATFLPQELLTAAGASPHGVVVLFVQLVGALYLGFAVLNWYARGSLIGGIYNKPLVLANLLHFGVSAIALAKAGGMLPILTAVYVAFAVAFTWLAFFWSPVKAAAPA